MIPDYVQMCDNFREALSKLETEARAFAEMLKNNSSVPGNKGEVIAQATIAMRHIEDSRMRYGKVIQYLGDGVSKFDKQKEGAEAEEKKTCPDEVSSPDETPREDAPVQETDQAEDPREEAEAKPM